MDLVVFAILGLLLSATAMNIAYAQEPFTRKVENITIPYMAANADAIAPEHYRFPSKHEANWILSIQNNLLYNTENPDAKVVLRMKENPEDTDFVEITMFSPQSYTFQLAIANKEVGYMPMYEDTNAWFEDRAIALSFVQNERLSVNNGQRIVLDRLRIGGFTLNTIEVFGRDDASADMNAFGGDLTLNVVSGNPLDNPILIVPPILAAVTAVVIITLLKIKKRT